MVRSPTFAAPFPVERFVLDRRNWASLKAWGARAAGATAMRRVKPLLEPTIETRRLVLRPLARIRPRRHRRRDRRLRGVAHAGPRAAIPTAVPTPRASSPRPQQRRHGKNLDLVDRPRRPGHRRHWPRRHPERARVRLLAGPRRIGATASPPKPARAVLAYGFDDARPRRSSAPASSPTIPARSGPEEARLRDRSGVGRQALACARHAPVAHIDTVLTPARFRGTRDR